MNQKYHRLILLGLFLLLGIFLHLACTRDSAGTPAFADASPLTGIPIDEELMQLLKQVVPYDPPANNALPMEKRFLFNLNKLINEDLAEQSEKYKLAAAKLALRQALAINKTVDTIEVRRYSALVKEPYGGYSGPHGIDVKGKFWWVLGGVIEDRSQWDNTNNDYGYTTNELFYLTSGRIANVKIYALVDTCGGVFSSCCGGTAYPPGMDDAWFQNFVDIGRKEDFPFTASEYTPKLIENYFTGESLNLSNKTTTEGIAELAGLKTLTHLTVDTTVAKDADAMREAFFDLFPKLPNLQTIEMSTGPVTVAQMQKLGECQNLTNLTLTNFSTDTPEAYTPINRLKKLEKLTIVPSSSWNSSWAYPWLGSSAHLSFADLAQPHPGLVEIHDLPNLEYIHIVGATRGHAFSLKNLPSLTFLVTDAPQLAGDIFTERTPPNLKVLICAGLAITGEQMRHIAALEQLETLALYGLRPASLSVFSPFQNMKTLKQLSLFFKTDQFRDETLTTPPVELSFLDVRFPGGHAGAPRINLRIPKLAVNYNLNVNYVTLVGDLPPFPGNVCSYGATMTYDQFQTLFARRDEIDPRFQYNSFTFSYLNLTDIHTDDLFVDFAFPHELKILFDSYRMEKSLSGKTLHFEKCDRLAQLNVSVPALPDVDVRISGLTKIRSYQVSSN